MTEEELGRAMLAAAKKDGQKSKLPGSTNSATSKAVRKRRARIVKHLRSNPDKSIEEIAARYRTSPNTANNDILKLQADGAIFIAGKTDRGAYKWRAVD